MAQDAAKIHVGAARIWLQATAPATGNPPTLTPHTDGVPTAGTPVEAGHTTGVTTVTYTPTKVDIDSEQAFGVVDTYVSTETVEVTFTIQERNYAALKLAFDAIGNVDDGTKTLFFAGGVYAVTSQCVILTSRRRNDATKFEVVTIYKAQSLEPVTLGYSRTERSTIPVRIRGVHDTTRTVGDQLFQWYREK